MDPRRNKRHYFGRYPFFGWRYIMALTGIEAVLHIVCLLLRIFLLVLVIGAVVVLFAAAYHVLFSLVR